MSDLFVEIFPVEPDVVPVLAGYYLTVDGEITPEAHALVGTRLARHLRQAFGGHWFWSDDLLSTDNERTAVELMITLDFLRADQPDRYAVIISIDPAPAKAITAQVIADFILRTRVRDLREPMQDALDRKETRIRNATVERECRPQAWAVADAPAISLSIASRLIYDETVQQYIGVEREASIVQEKLAGLWVSDPVAGKRGEIIGVVGMLRDERARLSALPPHTITPEDLDAALDGEWVLNVRFGKQEDEYLARNLWLIIRLSHLSRFNVDNAQAIKTLQMRPATRAAFVKTVSDIAKEATVLGNGYNSRTYPDLFFSADFEMNLRYGQNRVRGFDVERVPFDFAECGAYHLRDTFAKAPVKVCVVNTLTFKIEDFVEAMRRELARNFDFSIDVIRERQVRVVSQSNLESAVRVVEKENPDIILAFFADDSSSEYDEDGDGDATADYIRSLTLGRALPTHVIRQSTLDNPDAMPGIIMSILGKTGSTPFVLAEPLENIDIVVGLDVVREFRKTAGDTRLTAIARVYRGDGKFLRYTVRELIVEDDALPYVLMRDLFPQRYYANQRIIIHHDGPIPPDLLHALAGWGQAIKAAFFPVEVRRFGAPRLYALVKGVARPPWGSAFKLSPFEALLVSHAPEDEITPQPLHVRMPQHTLLPPPLQIEQVLRSILVWTLLAYGAEKLPKLPVTTTSADQLSYWLGKGGRFENDEGAVPFWL